MAGDCYPDPVVVYEAAGERASLLRYDWEYGEDVFWCIAASPRDDYDTAQFTDKDELIAFLEGALAALKKEGS